MCKNMKELQTVSEKIFELEQKKAKKKKEVDALEKEIKQLKAETSTYMKKRQKNELTVAGLTILFTAFTKMLYKQYDGRCQLCGKKLTLDDMTLDHIVPLNLGGADRLENIQIACFACNQLKKNILPEDFLNRVTNVFMYQMEKKCRHNLQWKCIKRLLKTLG